MVVTTNSPEVVGDSEEDQPPKTKKSTAKDSEESSSSKAENENKESGEEEDEEYEIEAILDARNGAFPEGRMGYLVKWKGYDDKHNSWVDELDAGNAQELIDEYWARTKKDQKNKPKPSKIASRRKSDGRAASQGTDKKRKKSVESHKSKSMQLEDAESSDAQMDNDDENEPRKRARASETKLKEKQKERRLNEYSPIQDKMEVDEAELEGYVPVSSKLRKPGTWEDVVDSIDTIERKNGTLNVFFTLKNGIKVFESSEECAKRFPQKLIKFYESHLRWTESDT